jgi:hypothetical protein
MKQPRKTLKSPEQAKPPAAPPKMTEAQEAAMQRHHARRKRLNIAPGMKVEKRDDNFRVSINHPDQATGGSLICEALGTADLHFVQSFLTQLTNVASKGQTPDADAINFALAVVKGIEPRDQMEALLGLQMAATHNAIMTFARRLAHVETLPQQDSAQNAFNKLCRTFTTQMEALKRYRNGGQQTVTVQHVNVSDGGQAIVGTVNHGGPVKKSDATP